MSMNTYFKKILNTLPVVILATFLFVTAAYAQTFAQPSSAPPTGNALAPLSLGSGPQIKSGNFGEGGTLNSTNGFAFQGPTPNSYTTSWATVSGLNTLSLEQFCMGGACTSSVLFPMPPKLDIYLGQTSCNGGGCSGDPWTAAEVCQLNGYKHLVGTALGTNGNSITNCSWSNGSWSCGGGCTSSCGNSDLSMVSCDNNGVTSPLSASAANITPNNGSTNILQANTPKSFNGLGGNNCGSKYNCQTQ